MCWAIISQMCSFVIGASLKVMHLSVGWFPYTGFCVGLTLGQRPRHIDSHWVRDSCEIPF